MSGKDIGHTAHPNDMCESSLLGLDQVRTWSSSMTLAQPEPDALAAYRMKCTTYSRGISKDMVNENDEFLQTDADDG